MLCYLKYVLDNLVSQENAYRQTELIRIGSIASMGMNYNLRPSEFKTISRVATYSTLLLNLMIPKETR
jgi:hypothetical protein